MDRSTRSCDAKAARLLQLPPPQHRLSQAAAPAAVVEPAAAPAAVTPIESAVPVTAAAASTPSNATVAITHTPAGWYPDPSGRYEMRYWDGLAWTEHVSRQGQQFTDPPTA